MKSEQLTNEILASQRMLGQIQFEMHELTKKYNIRIQELNLLQVKYLEQLENFSAKFTQLKEMENEEKAK